MRTARSRTVTTTSPAETVEPEWLEIENIDPDTGELLGTHLQRVDADGEPVGEPVDAVTHRPAGQAPKLVRRPRTIRIGVVVPLTSLLSNNDTPAELADRTGFIPGETLRQHIADAIDSNRRDQVLFTRLLTDDGGRLLDTTELGRYPSTRLAKPSPSAPEPAATPPAPSPQTAATSTTTNQCQRAPHPHQHGSVLPPTPPRQDLMHYDGQPASPTAGARARTR